MPKCSSCSSDIPSPGIICEECYVERLRVAAREAMDLARQASEWQATFNMRNAFREIQKILTAALDDVKEE